MRPTLRLGSTGYHVAAWQALIGVRADGSFGQATLVATKAFQAAHGVVADGIVGERSWRAAGEVWTAPRAASDPRAPACVQALEDANARWPGRSRASDGILGDASHAARKSDHNAGLAVDITHDPLRGPDGDDLAELAIRDPRVTYVIWNRRIWSASRAGEGWRAYSGSNPHTHHIHISIREDGRGDVTPWEWAP